MGPQGARFPTALSSDAERTRWALRPPIRAIQADEAPMPMLYSRQSYAGGEAACHPAASRAGPAGSRPRARSTSST